MKRLAILLVSSFFSFAALSANAGFYMGAMAGMTDPDSDIEMESDNGIRISAGYSFVGVIAIEAAYVSLGKYDIDLGSDAQSVLDATSSATDAVNLGADPQLTGSASSENSGLELAAIVKLPINPVFDFYARAGLFVYDLDIKASISGKDAANEDFSQAETATSSDNGFVYGVGLAFTRIPKLTLKLEYAAYTSEFDDEDAAASVSADVDSSFVGLGLQYHF